MNHTTDIPEKVAMTLYHTLKLAHSDASDYLNECEVSDVRIELKLIEVLQLALIHGREPMYLLETWDLWVTFNGGPIGWRDVEWARVLSITMEEIRTWTEDPSL